MVVSPEAVRWDLYPHVATHFQAKAFIHWLVLHERCPKTIDAYARAIDDFLHTFPEPEQLLEANEADLMSYLASLKQRTPRRSKYTFSSHVNDKAAAPASAWRKLAGAAARLSEADLPRSHQYPLSLYRAVALLWITTARRPNELQRLRLDGVRREWDHEMLDEDELPLERGEDILEAEKGKSLCYLHIPTNKYGGEFWIWVPQYAADAIDEWKKDRGMANEALYDAKDRTFADLLFCHRGKPLGGQFLNEHLIPLLCRTAGNIPPADAKGRFTGHRGRSTRITLLRRCGMDLDDLAEYAGHKNTATIRHYARTDPLQLHRKIAKADALSQIIEGLIDLKAAAAGQPSVRWFLGYDADGQPQFCGLPAHQTCPHRMDCLHCGLFIGGEKARLLNESEHVQPIWTEMPMTPPLQLLCEGQKEAAQCELERLKDTPTPVPPSVAFLTNPLGLSEQRLEELAKEGTADALAQLTMVAQALQESLREYERQGKDGRNVVVKQFRERLDRVTSLIVQCQMVASGPPAKNGADEQKTVEFSR